MRNLNARGGYQQIPEEKEFAFGERHSLQYHKSNAAEFDKARKPKYGEQKYRFKDLESTTFDAFLFCTCSLVDTSMSYEKGVLLQFFFALGLQIVTVILQLGLVVLLFSTVVEELEAPYEYGLSEKSATLADALEKQTIIDKSDPAVKLCRKDHTLLGVHVMVLWIWISKMLREVTYAVELIMVFWCVESTPSVEDPEQKHQLRYRRDGNLCEPMNKARFLKQGKPKIASEKEKELTNMEYWNEVMEKVVTPDGKDIKATELRRDLEKLWSKGTPMTFPDLYDEMEGVVNGLPKAERPKASEFKKELEEVWSKLDKLPHSATEIIDEDVVLNGKGQIVNEAYTILYLTPFLRCLFIVFHAGLQILVAVGLMFVSAKYLILSSNMANVILKAVSMQFIMTLDALIFSAFIPTSFAKKIKSARITYVGERPSPRQQWSASVAYVIIAVCSTFLLRNIIYGKDEEFRSLCREYYIANPNERNIPMDIFVSIAEAIGEGLKKPIVN